jgi:4-hydroxybenzoate polyprenyltransferase
LNPQIIELLRLSKPTGTLLLFLPCAFSILLFSKNSSDLAYLFLFFIGSIIMRSAGCIINDLLDRDFDIKVARTASRPLAAKTISVFSALCLLALLLLTGLLILTQLSPLAIKIGLFAAILVPCYPLIKRFSYFPQVFLGFTFNIGVLISAATILGRVPLESIVLYTGCIFWTIGYDTVYGFMDIKDDKKIGIKSLSIKLEQHNFKIWLTVFYSIFMLCALYSALSITRNLQSFLIFLPWAMLIKNTINLDITSPDSCMNHFNNSRIVGFMICAILGTA